MSIIFVMIITPYMMKLKLAPTFFPLLSIDLGSKCTGLAYSSDGKTVRPLDIF